MVRLEFKKKRSRNPGLNKNTGSVQNSYLTGFFSSKDYSNGKKRTSQKGFPKINQKLVVPDGIFDDKYINQINKHNNNKNGVITQSSIRGMETEPIKLTK